MAMDLRYYLYDTAILSTVVNTEFQLFKVPQGGDATHTENFTNMRGAGSLPTEEKFIIDWVGVIIDYDTVIGDIRKMWLKSFLEIRVNDKSVLKAPLIMFSNQNMYGGHYTQAAAADQYAVGPMGDGMELDKKIEIPGGTSFFIRLFQGTALSAATCNTKVVLGGVYTLPN